MLTIRAAQMQVMRHAVWDDFVRSTVELLQADIHAAPQPITDAVALRRVTWALERGRAHGLSSGTALLRYASCVLRHGPRFDRHPAVQLMLAASGLTPDARMMRLVHGLPQRVWDELQLLAAAADWRAIDEEAHGRPG